MIGFQMKDLYDVIAIPESPVSLPENIQRNGQYAEERGQARHDPDHINTTLLHIPLDDVVDQA
jgi:hypothetical protein